MRGGGGGGATFLRKKCPYLNNLNLKKPPSLLSPPFSHKENYIEKCNDLVKVDDFFRRKFGKFLISID